MSADSTQPDAAIPPKRRRRRRWIILALLLAAVVWIGCFVHTRLTGEPTPRPEYWTEKIMSLDPPPPGAITEDEALRILSQRPFEKNIRYQALKQETSIHIRVLLDHPWDPHKKEIQILSDIFGDPTFVALRLELRQALQKGWPVDPQVHSLVYRNIGDYDLWAMRLAMHGRWAIHDQNDPELMLDDWRMMLLLARQLQRPRCHPYYHLASRIHRWAGIEMLQLRPVNDPPIDSRAWAGEVDRITGPRLAVGTFTEGDRLVNQHLLESVYVTEDKGGWLSVKALSGLYGTNLTGGGNISVSPWWNLASPVFHDLDTAQAEHDAYYDQIVARTVDLASAHHLGRHGFDDQQCIMPSLLGGNPRWLHHRSPEAKAYENQLTSRCTLDAGLTMLALREYHRRNGEYPESLDELVPDFLPRLPIDDAHEARQPLRYRRTKDGLDYVLYSVGLNGVDDGGSHRGGPPDFLDSQPDVVFSAVDRRMRPQ